MFKKAFAFGLVVSIFAAAGCTNDQSQTIDKLEDYQGQVSLADGQSLSLLAQPAAGADGGAATQQSVQTGQAVFEFSSHQHFDQNGVQDAFTSQMSLKQNGIVFTFSMPSPQSILQNVNFFLSASDSGQPNPMTVTTAPDVLNDVNQSQETISCSWDCNNKICYGSQVKTTLYKIFTRDITVTWGTPDSTADHFTPVATFTGSFQFNESESDTTGCL